MSRNEARNRNVLDADGRSTETEQRPHYPADCYKWWVWRLARLPTVDSLTDGSLPADDWSEQSGGNVDQADRRHEPVDSGMTAQFHEWPCTRARPSSPSIGSGLRRVYECVRVTLAVDEPCCREYHLPL